MCVREVVIFPLAYPRCDLLGDATQSPPHTESEPSKHGIASSVLPGRLAILQVTRVAHVGAASLNWLQIVIHGQDYKVPAVIALQVSDLDTAYAALAMDSAPALHAAIQSGQSNRG